MGKEILPKCDQCDKRCDGDYITTDDVPNEGCSYINYKNANVEIGGQHFCCFDCLVAYLRKWLQIDDNSQ